MKVVSVIVRICRLLLIVCMALLLVVTVFCAPMLFGYRPFVVSDTQDANYSAGALTYFRYEAADALQEGTPVAVQKETGFAICTLGVSDTLPAEWIEGRVAGFSVPYLGAVCKMLCAPLGLVLTGVVILLLCFGAFLLPKLIYSPKYGKKGRTST